MFHQQASDELRGDQLCKAAEKLSGEGWETLGGEHGSYGSGCSCSTTDMILTCTGDTARLQTSPLQAISEKQLQAFQEVVKADTSLQEKPKVAADADAVVAMAKAAGFLISSEVLVGAPGDCRECF